MRYLGGKSRLAPLLSDQVVLKAPSASLVTDLFAGSLGFASHMKSLGFTVTTNDVLHFSYVLSRGTLALNQAPDLSSLTEHLTSHPIDHLLTHTPAPTPDDFIRLNYSPDSTPVRKYLTSVNALRIDSSRQLLNTWYKQRLLSIDGYYYLLASLLSAIPYVSNTTGTYASFLKHWDSRALKDLPIKAPVLFNGNGASTALNMDAMDVLKTHTGEVLYLDPPYNARQYLPNYHVLETVSLYDSPPVKGVTGQRPGKDKRSPFCSKNKALPALNDLIEAAQYEHIFLSYNTEGLIPVGDLSDVMRSHAAPGSFELLKIPYRRYKNKIPNNTPGLAEVLCYIRKS